MADIKSVYGVRDGASEAITLSAGAADQTAVPGQDERYCILVQNTDATTAGIVVEAGAGLRASIGDLVCTVAQNEMKIIELDSSRFKKLKGDSKGKYVLHIKNAAGTGAFGGTVANVKLAAINL